MDTPGTGSNDPLKWKQIADALADASGVLVVCQRNMAENNELQLELVNSGWIPRMIRAPSECPMIVFSSNDEKGEFCSAKTFLDERALTFDERRQKGRGGGLFFSCGCVCGRVAVWVGS